MFVFVSGCCIDSYVAAMFGGSLHANSSLVSLSLRVPSSSTSARRMRSEGAIALARGLTSNTTLRSLDISGHSIRNSGLFAFFSLFNSTNLILLDVSNNYINDAGALGIVQQWTEMQQISKQQTEATAQLDNDSMYNSTIEPQVTKLFYFPHIYCW
jgi:hypothetical protein